MKSNMDCISTNRGFSVSAADFVPKAERALTIQEKEEMNEQCNLIRQQLDAVVAVCDYVFFNQFQAIVYNKILVLNNECNAIVKFSKSYKDLVAIKRDVDDLVRLCYKSESKEILPYISCILNCYADKYCEDGGVFIDYACYRYSNELKECIGKLKSKIHKGVRHAQFDKSKTELCTYVMLAELLCSTLNNIVECCNDKLKDSVLDIIHNKYGQHQLNENNLNFRTIPIKEFRSLHFHLNNIGETLLGNKHISNNIHLEELKSLMRDVANTMLDRNSKMIIRDIFSKAIEDYTNYCIASMIIHYRKHLELDPDVNDKLVSLGIDVSGRNALIMEIKNASICPGETDPHEMKLYIDDIEEREFIDLFRKMLNVGTEEMENKIATKWKEIKYEYE